MKPWLACWPSVPKRTAWVKSQVFWVMPEQVFLSRLPGQPPLSRWIAQIESVDTLEAYRNRGVARAFLAAAITAARDAADLVFLIADAADWPQQLYGKLGFDPVGTFRQFTKPPPGETDR